MQANRRAMLKSFLVCCAACLHGLSAPAWGLGEAIEVAITVRDESDRPIPHVAVWSTVEPDRRHIRAEEHYKYLSVDDLWRVTRRHGDLHDVIAQHGDKPVNGLRVTVMADGSGGFHESLDYQEVMGDANRQGRPDSLTFGYTFMKRGYRPGRVAFTAPKSQNRVDATVRLERDPGEALETQPYLQAFARLRYELSDTRRDSELTEGNRQRVESLRQQMEAAAQQALAAGDKRAATRIYSRMRHLPSVHVVDGQVTGWNHGDPGSEEARRALDLAYELEPDDLYVWTQTYPRRRSLLPNPTMEERLAALLWEVEKLIDAKGEAVWPQCYAHQASSHALLGHYETAYRIYKEAARREPKYMNWDAEIKILKAEMKSRGIKVPAD